MRLHRTDSLCRIDTTLFLLQVMREYTAKIDKLEELENQRLEESAQNENKGSSLVYGWYYMSLRFSLIKVYVFIN